MNEKLVIQFLLKQIQKLNLDLAVLQSELYQKQLHEQNEVSFQTEVTDSKINLFCNQEKGECENNEETPI